MDTFLVTGANTGIGRSTAQELARRGGRVVFACRSEAKTTPVMAAIASETGNDGLSFLALDLADLASVRSAAQTLLARDDPLHVLVNNAGVGGAQGKTAQGFEMHFGVNHLGHFLLTQLLLPRLLDTSAQTGRASRVVNVSSDAAFQASTVPFDRLQSAPGLTGLREYAVSKLCNVLFAQELARRFPEPQLNTSAAHPGVIASDIWRRIPGPARWLMTRFMRSADEGAATSIHCATSDDVVGQSGSFYADCRAKDGPRAATPELASELWRRSEEWTEAFRL